MKLRATTVIAMLLLSACATLPSGAGRTPGPLSGQWVGAFASHEIVAANGLLEPPAELTLGEDGRWTLTSSGGAVATGVARPTAKGLRLEGHVTAGDHMTVGREVWFDLRPGRDGALCGQGQTFYLGHRVTAELLLAAERR